MRILPLLFFQPPAGPSQNSPGEQAEALGKFGDAVLRADVDFYNLPFSRNAVGNAKASSGLARFSEYHPKHLPHPKPNAIIPRETFGRAHAEVRPIRGTKESLLTRFVLDYQGGEVFSILPKPLRPLEIDCFTAVTPPTLEYDRSFKDRKAVRKIGRDGSVKYQNACREGKLATPFDSVAAPPPKTGNNPDWMFYFQPVRDTGRAKILEGFINRRVGALWLWASNPTYGFTDPTHYERFGIRYNTWPRRLGDLLRFFGPWLDAELRETLKQKAPYLNPNQEYLDAHGKRQSIPTDPAELAALNKERKTRGLPPVPRSRGPAVDWTFSDLLKDPERLKATPADRYPSISARIQLRPGSILPLPEMGWLKLGEKNEIRFSYRIYPKEIVVGGKKEFRVFGEIRLQAGPLEISGADLRLGPYRLQLRNGLKVDRLDLRLPMEYLPDRPDRPGSWRVGAGSVEIGGGKARGVHLHSPVGQIRIAMAELKQASFHADADFQEFELTIPELKTSGTIAFLPKNLPGTRLTLEGRGRLSNLRLRRIQEGGESRASLSLKVGGAFRKIQAESPVWGRVGFTQEENGILHPLQGTFRADLATPRDPRAEKPPMDYELKLSLPYAGFHLGSLGLVMREGESFLKNGKIEVAPKRLALEGEIQLKVDEIKDLPGTDVLRLQRLTVYPHLEEIFLKGGVRLEYSPEKFSLKKLGEHLSLEFKLTDSRFTHLPFDEDRLKAKPLDKVVRSDVAIDQALVEISDLQEVEYRTLETDGSRRGQVSELRAGPILIHHIQGGGEIWVNTLLWSWLRGHFPKFGVPLAEVPHPLKKPPPKKNMRPDVEKILDQLTPELRAKLWDEALGDYSNFVYLGGLSVQSDPAGKRSSRTILSDLRINAHETGHYWQFALLRIPKIILRQSFGKKGLPVVEVDAGFEKIFTHIFLKEPKRGYDRFEVKSLR